MNRFLHKEWTDWEPNRESCQRVRDLAWERYSQGRLDTGLATRRAWWMAAAASVVLLLLWATPGEPGPFPVEKTLAALPVDAHPAKVFHDSPPASLAMVVRPAPNLSGTRKEPVDQVEAVRRVVLDFQLPESRVRMIWIQDRDFGPIEEK